jgi:L-lactate dehydrogenase complex protein LldG
MNDPSHVLDKVCRALGRSVPLAIPPTPPPLDRALIRFVKESADLAEHFTRTATSNKMQVHPVTADSVGEKIVDLLRQRNCQRIGLSSSPSLDRFNIPTALRHAGLDLRMWSDLERDAVYDMDCGITDVAWAIAETGSLAIRPSPAHGRSISLVPPLHIAIVQPENLIADLVDLFAEVPRDAIGVTLITGPSKTADIEGRLVVGVHGPGQVHILLLQ